MDKKVLFECDQKKVDDAVLNHAMGSYQVGEVARLSAGLYDRGIDVAKHLRYLHLKYGIEDYK